MIEKIKEITEAWIIAANPSESQKQLGEERLKICNDCEKITYRKKTGNPMCGECGCPLKKKIFSRKYDACPLHKWLEIEKSDLFKSTQKISNTFL